MQAKSELRTKLKRVRRDFVAAIPPTQHSLLFRRPPTAVAAVIGTDSTIAVYHEVGSEAPATHYARWFFEQGHRIALPWFAQHGAPMQFRQWENPMLEREGLERAPLGGGALEWAQPSGDAALLEPDVAFCPLLAFTANGARLGYGGGHYDRWLANHSPAMKIGLAWDCQLVDELPLETHDVILDAVVTQSRIYGTLG